MLAPRTVPLLTTLVLAQACGSRSGGEADARSPDIDTARVRAEIAEMWDQFNRAEENHDLSGLVATVAEDVRVDGEGQAPLLGRAAFEAKARSDFAARRYNVVDFSPISTTVRSPDAAYQYGTLLETHTPVGGKTETAHGRWAGEMARGSDGKWRIRYIIGFLDSISSTQ